MLTVGEALQLKALRKTKVVGGKKGLNRNIRYVTVMEVPDICQWLKGEDFILTSFYAVYDDLERQCEIIRQLNEVGSSALAIKTDRYIKNIPSEVKKTADKLKFPLIEIPKDVTYIDILTPLMQEILQREQNLRHREEYINEVIFGRYKNQYSMIERGKTLGYKLNEGLFTVISMDIDNFEKIAREYNYNEEKLSNLKKEIYTYVLGIARDLKQNQLIINYMITRQSDSVTLILQNDSKKSSIGSCKKAISDISWYLEHYLRDIKITIGCSREGLGLEGIQEGYKQARIAIKLGKAFGGKKSYYHFNDMAIYNIIYEKCAENMEDIAIYTLGGIIENKELIKTLCIYFENNEDIGKASKYLFIHENTLRYRLNNIKTKTGLDVRQVDDKVKLYLGLMAYKLLYERTKN